MFASSRNFLYAIALRRPGMNQLLAITGQIPKLPDGPRRDKTSLEQPFSQQLSDPLAIFDIGLSSRHMLDMAGVDHHDLKIRFQHVIYRLSVNTGAFHRNVRASLLGQPVIQCQQVNRHRPVCLRFHDWLFAKCSGEDRRDHGVLMNIQTR